MRLQGKGSTGAASCGRAAGDSIAYQAAITRDLHGGVHLLRALFREASAEPFDQPDLIRAASSRKQGERVRFRVCTISSCELA